MGSLKKALIGIYSKKLSVQLQRVLKIIDDVAETVKFGGGRTDALANLHFGIICSKCMSNQLRK